MCYILFYFILFYFILFYFILFYLLRFSLFGKFNFICFDVDYSLLYYCLFARTLRCINGSIR